MSGTDPGHDEAAYGLSRRFLLGAGLSAVAFGAAGAGGATSAAAATAGAPQDAVSPGPDQQMRMLMKMMASLAADVVPWYYTGRIYALRPGSNPVHLYNFEGTEIYWTRPLSEQSWSLAGSTLTFYRDRDTGEYLDAFDNPLTGKRVAVSANVLRSPPHSGVLYAGRSMTMMGATQPVVVEIHRNADLVWLTTGRSNGAPSMEVNTLFASAADINDRHRPNVPASFSSVSLSRWSAWLEMGDEEGQLLWHSAGRKLASLAQLPADYRRRADAVSSVHFRNPDTAPAVAVQSATAARPRPPDAAAGLEFSYVKGAGGVPLSVAQAGNSASPGILFLHGLGQSHLSFSHQLHSPLAERFRLVAFDLRGHGNSGKPWEAGAYADGRLWADDVHEVIAGTGLARPLIVAWSYGTLVIADYIRHYGTAPLAGIVMIGALGGLASAPMAAPDANVVSTFRELHALGGSPGLENTLKASHATVPLLTARSMPRAWTLTAETVNAMVPPFARTPMTERMAPDNSDVISRIETPMILMAGSEDRGTTESLMRTLAGKLPKGATVSVYPGCGHSPFAEDPERFNAELLAFAADVHAATER